METPPRATRSAGPTDPGPGGGTGFPYHAPGLPALRARTLAFSSSQADTPDLVANNWPNLVLWLHEPLELQRGQALEVQSLADLSVDPHIYSAWGSPLGLQNGCGAPFAPTYAPSHPPLTHKHAHTRTRARARRLALPHQCPRGGGRGGEPQAGEGGRGRGAAHKVVAVERAPHP